MIKIMILESNTLQEAQRQYGIHRATFYRAKKRGYFCLGYHKKEIDIHCKIDVDLAYKIAKSVQRKYFARLDLQDDLIQEGVLEILLKGGKGADLAASYARLASQGMRGYIYKFCGRNRKTKLTTSFDFANV